MDFVRIIKIINIDHLLTIFTFRDNDITDAIYETFSVDDEVFGEKRTIDLKADGRNIEVTNDNKKEWVE